jgi:hypothetical protein
MRCVAAACPPAPPHRALRVHRLLLLLLPDTGSSPRLLARGRLTPTPTPTRR